MKFFLSVLTIKGHLNPLLPVAQHLQALGHDVGIYGDADLRRTINKAGLNNFLGYTPWIAAQDNVSADELAVRTRQRKAEDHYKVFKKYFVDRAYNSVTAARRVIDDYDPDVILIDPVKYDFAIAAILSGRPWMALSCSLMPVVPMGEWSDVMTAMRMLDPDRLALFASFGINDAVFRGWDCISKYGTTCFSTPEFIGFETPGVELVGPSVPLGHRGDEVTFPWDQLRPDKKKVFVAFGSQISYQENYFNKIIDASQSCDWQLILALGKEEEKCDLHPLPPDTITVTYAPQVRLLSNVDLFINHGGANSVMECLAAGVPQIVSPITVDQFHQARFVERAGVGVTAELDKISMVELKRCIEGIWHNSEMGAAVRKIAESYKRDGARRAADFAIDLGLRNSEADNRVPSAGRHG